jgi:hypothetical protein
VWGIVPTDPGFEGEGAWVATGPGVEFLDETGLDPGLVLLDETALCDGSMVSQTVEMPGSTVGDTFAVEMTYRTRDAAFRGAVEVYVGNALRTLPEANATWNQIRFCLGEAAYGALGDSRGGMVEFRIGGAERDRDCVVSPAGALELDRFQVVVAQPGECPAPGTVLNGQAEPERGGWTQTVDDTNPARGVATAALEPGVGRDGTGGARIAQDGGGNLLGIGTRFSVPLPTDQRGKPALEFWWRAEGLLVFAETGPEPRTNFPFTYLELYEASDGSVSRYCLPPWTYGSVVELWFLPSSGQLAGEFVVDDVRIVNDERCGRSDTMLDPGFDSAPNRWPGALWGLNAPSSEQPVRIAPGRGRSGEPEDGALALTYVTNRDLIVVNQWVRVPEANELEGPVLTIHSNILQNGVEPGVQVSGIVSRNTGFELEEFLPAGVGWVQTPFCLPRGWAGRWLRFRVEARNRTEFPPFQVYETPQEVLLDDFELTTSAACVD